MTHGEISKDFTCFGLCHRALLDYHFPAQRLHPKVSHTSLSFQHLANPHKESDRALLTTALLKSKGSVRTTQ
jgi:hypothetical protein